MRDQLHLMELVDHYLDGTMSNTDRTGFEERMKSNEELRSLVDDQQRLRQAARRSPARAAAKQAYRKYKGGKSLPGITAGAVLIMATAAWFLWKSPGFNSLVQGDENASGTYAVLSDTTGTHADPLVLNIDPERDTTLVTPNGIVLDIPQGAFVDEDGKPIHSPVRVTMIEALDPLDIMKAGLSTMSGDTLLETGGMFYFDAQADGKSVKIDPAKPLTAMVPAADQQDMMLYAGVKREDGMIDWQNPKPLKKSLVPVDITTLNFYPQGYEAKLTELGQDVTNKVFRDSLYYSFSWRDTVSSRNLPAEVVAELAAPDSIAIPYQRAELLFLQHCSSCHKPDVPMTGPALKGARARWQGKGDIYAFTKNAMAYLETGNRYATALFNRYNKSVMTPNALSNEEIDAILGYADGFIGKSEKGFSGIDPAKVKAIWNKRFNNTNLATKEFEERMRALHGTCNNAALDVYVSNLETDLSELDRGIAMMGYPEFDHFAERNDGRVELPAHAADRLRTFYESNSRAEAEAIRKTQKKFWRKQWKLDVKSDAKRSEHALAEVVREGELFQKELAENFDTVYKQLGYKRVQLPRSAWVVPVTSPGWWNVDKAVIQATTTRTSMKYTDDQTGKTATLTYTPLIVEVTDRASYDELVVYLIPTQLNSYQRMKEGAGGFTEKLNSIFTYDLFCLGMKGKQQFAFTTRATGQAEIPATLVAGDDNALRQMLRAKGSLERELLDEARHFDWLAADKQRRKANADRKALRNELMPVVFPCADRNEPGTLDSTGIAF